MAKNFFHRIVLKDDAPVYRKQYQIPEAHSQFIEETLQEWLKLGVVRPKKSWQGTANSTRLQRIKQTFSH